MFIELDYTGSWWDLSETSVSVKIDVISGKE
jgi:hypothetical protein